MLAIIRRPSRHRRLVEALRTAQGEAAHWKDEAELCKLGYLYVDYLVRTNRLMGTGTWQLIQDFSEHTRWLTAEAGRLRQSNDELRLMLRLEATRQEDPA